jgi:Mn2+/Fe2+ NRAMP family transporter
MARRSREEWSGILESLGPGLLWAAAAIGVSHLVQSTRAGAVYGFGLMIVVVAANLLKYPFFEFGPRYAAATGESLVEGYERLGRWAVWVYLALTLGTVFTVVGAVTFVTGAIATQLFGPSLSPFGYSVALLVLSALILIPGKYPLLDKAVKVIIVILTLSTLAAVAAASTVHRQPVAGFVPPALWNVAGFSFLIALVGWMPSAVDIAVWHSLWTLERAKETGHKPRLAEALFDFNLGYVGTAVLALFFVALGALIMYGGGEAIPEAGGAFAARLIALYTGALGPWSRWVIVIAAFTTMYSTVLTCVDAFPRALERTVSVLVPGLEPPEQVGWLYWAWMLVVIAGSVLLIGVFRGYLTRMVDFATTLSFLTAPVLGYFNYRVVTGRNMPPGTAPPRWLRALSWTGLAFLTVFGLIFVVWRFGLH